MVTKPSLMITEKKLNGKSLSQSDIEFIVNGYISGMINDSEMTNFLKAVFQQGMNHQETLDSNRYGYNYYIEHNGLLAS